MQTRRSALQIPSSRLFALDGFEEGFKISFAKAAAAFALDDFVKERGAILDWAREELKHVALIVAIYQHAEFAELVDGLVDLADARFEIVVVGRGHAQEVDAVAAQ